MGFMGGFSMMKNGGLRIVFNHTHRIHGAGMYANIKGYIDGIRHKMEESFIL